VFVFVSQKQTQKEKLNQNSTPFTKGKQLSKMMSESPIFDMSDVYVKPAFPQMHKARSYMFDDYNVIQLWNCAGEKTCVSVYNNESLQTLYDRAIHVLYASSMIYPNPAVSQCQNPETHPHDYIPSPHASNKENELYHLFVCDTKDQVVKIPCDENTTFGAFRNKYPRFFVPSSKLPILQLLHIYVFDDRMVEYLEEETKKLEQTTFYKLQRFFTCKLTR
jgi:hypothetical protein